MEGKQVVALTINGDSHEIACAPNTTLLEALREKALLTGTKRGCDLGACGACTVLLNGQAVLACLTLAVEAQGREVLTIEGIAAENGGLSALQRAFVDHGALQCGFCSPGFIMSATELLAENPNPTRSEIQRKLAGNLCRCTGYVKIVEAVELAASKLQGGAA